MRIEKPGHKLFVVGISGLLGVAVILTGYFFGHHNIYLSRSFFLEKDIRRLLYLETHEPIDYAHAVENYEDLLAQVHFDQSQGDYLGRYEKALARTREKKRIVELLDKHLATGDLQFLREAHQIVTSQKYLALEEYHFTCIWYNGTRLSLDWFDFSIKEPTSGDESQNE